MVGKVDLENVMSLFENFRHIFTIFFFFYQCCYVAYAYSLVELKLGLKGRQFAIQEESQ